MPRQFFTLKSILTAPPGTFGGNGLGAPSSTVATAERLALSDESIIEIDGDDEGSRFQEDDEAERLEGAPPTADEEVLYQDEPNHEEHEEQVEVQPVIPPQVHAYIQQMQQQMQMMAQQLQYHQQKEKERQQQLAQREPEIPPPVARFANFVVYDGSFEPLQNQVGQILSESINEVMRLRARAAEAFERKAEDMLADLAMAVLGRELRSERADLAAIIAQMRARLGEESPVIIRIAPEEAHLVEGPVKPDESLAYGDLVFEVEDGELDLRLGTRIAAVLREQQVQV
jgi:flagellar biosynthesis/type III secretory pathway protein FliH